MKTDYRRRIDSVCDLVRKHLKDVEVYMYEVNPRLEDKEIEIGIDECTLSQLAPLQEAFSPKEIRFTRSVVTFEGVTWPWER